jgi:L-alanine-DL-glutamate epimerase-like enolase superfamily enzyme
VEKSFLIRETEVFPLQAPLLQPFRTALGGHDTLDNLAFVLTLSDGTRGFGEAAIATHITGETLASTRRHLVAAGPRLRGQDARDYLSLSGMLHERWGDNPAMIAAVETALFDALTRRHGVPLWQWFGPRPRRLRSDITVVIASLEETRETTARFYRQGFRRFKVKVGRDFEADVRRVEAVRTAAPRGIIYLDANQGFSAEQSLQFLRVLKRLKIRPALLEQPVPRADFDGLKKVSRSTDIPVCADESARSIPDVTRIIRERAASVISVKLMKSGVVRSVEIARLARAHGLALMVSGMMESGLAMTAAAHMAAGLGCFSYIDLDTAFFVRGEVERQGYLSSGGVYDLTQVRRGIGIRPRGFEKTV